MEHWTLDPGPPGVNWARAKHPEELVPRTAKEALGLQLLRASDSRVKNRNKELYKYLYMVGGLNPSEKYESQLG